jgi:hypothetical protein
MLFENHPGAVYSVPVAEYAAPEKLDGQFVDERI